jgi:hypothetical protein
MLYVIELKTESKHVLKKVVNTFDAFQNKIVQCDNNYLDQRRL